MNYFGTVSKIIKEYIELTEAWEDDGITKIFYVEFSLLMEWISEESSSTYRLDRVIEDNLSYVRKLKDLAQQRAIQLTASECLILIEFLGVLEDIYNNKRYQDPFSSLFVVQLKMFNMSNRNMGSLIKQKYLRSKEVIWAVHSQQTDSLFDICFPRDLQANPQFMNWDYFRKYCVPLWFDDGMKLKSHIEKIALFEFKESK